MKRHNKFLVPSLVAICGLAFSLTAARADDGQEGGGDVQGTESFDMDVAMTPTAAAPVGSSAEVSLEAEDDNGDTSAAKLKIEAKNFPAGTFSVSVTLKSDGSTVSLGSFTLNAGDSEIEFGDDDNGMPFPANFNPFDIATISLSDSSNTVLFTANLTTAASASLMTRSASVTTTAGPGAPSSTGSAVLTANVIHGQTKGMLQLTAQGLPAANQLMVSVNGVNAKKTKSDKSGNISLTLGPKGKTGTVASGVNLFNVTSVTVRDQSGNLLLTGSF